MATSLAAALASPRTAAPRLGQWLLPPHGRRFTTTAPPRAGHNKWSKIRHDKGAADRKTAARRAVLAKNITLCSRLHGPDPSLNSRLVDAIALAKRDNMPKTSIDAAVARGQGRSSTGAQLEGATLEVMTAPPASVALIVDIETDNRNRTLHELRHLVKTHGGTVTPVTFLFRQRGRTVLRPRAKPRSYAKEGDTTAASTTASTTTAADFDRAFMQAVEAGAEDVEQDARGNIVVWTQPARTHHAAQSLSGAMGMDISQMDITWTPLAGRAVVDDDDAGAALAALLDDIRDNPDVQAVYGNAERGGVSEETWRAIERALD